MNKFKIGDRVHVTRDSLDVLVHNLPRLIGKEGVVNAAYLGSCNVRIDGDEHDTFLLNIDLKPTAIKVGDRVRDDKDNKGTVHYVYSSGNAFNVHMDDGSVFFCATHHITPIAPEPKETTVTTTPTTPTTATPTDPTAFNLAATKALVKVAKTKRSFTTDDLYAVMPKETHGDARLMGAFMAEAKKSTIVSVTKRFKRSKRTGGPLRVWKSLLKA